MATEHRWVRVTRGDNVPLREGRAVLVGDRELALFNLGPPTELGAGPSTELRADASTAGPSTKLRAGDRFLATDAHCPHQGGPLCDGIVAGDSVVCPLHGWKMALDTGQVVRPESGKGHCVQTYETRVEDGVVSIRVPVRASSVEAA